MNSKLILNQIKKYINLKYYNKIKDIRVNYKFIEKEGIKSPEADIYICCRNRNVIFFELEKAQPHPDTNFVKYWRWIEEYKIKNKIILIQIFSPMFNDENYIARVRNIEFLNKKTSLKNFSYYPVNCLVNKFSEEEFTRFGPKVKNCLFSSITTIFNKVVQPSK